MAQYIDKNALVAEIERCINKYNDKKKSCPVNTQVEAICDNKINAFKEVISLINTLEVKEKNFIWNNARTTVPEDSTNQIICIKEDGLAVSTVGKIVNGTIKWAYLDDLLNNFEVKEVDLEKERMSECPYRQIVCTMYEGKMLECKGACSWVVDYPKLKELKAQKGE